MDSVPRGHSRRLPRVPRGPMCLCRLLHFAGPPREYAESVNREQPLERDRLHRPRCRRDAESSADVSQPSATPYSEPLPCSADGSVGGAISGQHSLRFFPAASASRAEGRQRSGRAQVAAPTAVTLLVRREMYLARAALETTEHKPVREFNRNLSRL